MRLITRESNANKAAENWKKQYNYDGVWPDKLEILDRLEKLGVNPFPDDVDSVIGNTSWTRTICYECRAENIDVVEIGEDKDYESYTTEICKACLLEALQLTK